jgi:hypothetical protein
MRVLLWHVHGGWTDAFVRGEHDYLLPVNPAKDAWGLGRAGRPWPDSVVEVPIDGLREVDVDAVVLQRPEEIAEVELLTGRVPGRDLPAVYVEHNTPKPSATESVHPLADRRDIPIVHVTHFNRLFWNNGDAPTLVIEHGVADPGALYTGELGRIAAAINEPVRRWRVTGTDLLAGFAPIAPIDVFGMGAETLPDVLELPPGQVVAAGDLPPQRLHAELARRRFYLHPFRWTSLGLALLEAMHLGMPVVALDTTEASRAVPPEAGLVSNDLAALHTAAEKFLTDPLLAAERGRRAREFALAHYGLGAFLRNWNLVLGDLASRRPSVTGDEASGMPAHPRERNTR